MLNQNQAQALKVLHSRLSEAGIDWICIGGLAAIAYGAKRKLVDIDIQVSEKDIKKVRALFREEVTTDLRHYKTDRWDIQQFILNIQGVDVDVCRAEHFYVIKDQKKYLIPNCLEKQVLCEIAELAVPVLPKNQLIRYKRLTARQVDMADLQFLEK